MRWIQIPLNIVRAEDGSEYEYITVPETRILSLYEHTCYFEGGERLDYYITIEKKDGYKTIKLSLEDFDKIKNKLLYKERD